MPGTGSILVVDPQADVRAIASSILSSQSFDVQTAAGGREAVSLLENAPVDLVLTEVFMPGLCGGDLVREIHRAAPRARVVAMSGYLEQPLDCDVPFLPKPFTCRELVTLVRLALQDSGRIRAQVARSCEELRQVVEWSRVNRLRWRRT